MPAHLRRELDCAVECLVTAFLCRFPAVIPSPNPHAVCGLTYATQFQTQAANFGTRDAYSRVGQDQRLELVALTERLLGCGRLSAVERGQKPPRPLFACTDIPELMRGATVHGPWHLGPAN